MRLEGVASRVPVCARGWEVHEDELKWTGREKEGGGGSWLLGGHTTHAHMLQRAPGDKQKQVRSQALVEEDGELW